MRFWIVFILLFPTKTFSQQWLGIAPSNYSGTYGIYQNPANIVDTRYKAFVNLAGGNIDFSNNYAGWNAPYSIFGMMTNTVKSQHRAANGLIIYRNSYINQSFDKPNSTAFLGAEAKGPAFMYNFDKAKFAIGITSRARGIVNVSKLSPDIARILVEGTTIPDFYGKPKTDNHFNFNLNVYTELGATIGLVLREQDQDFMKIGLTFKRVNGMINSHIRADDIDFQIDQHPTRPKRQNVMISEAKGIFGIVSEDAISGFSVNPDWLVGNLSPAIGYGADIGFVYEFRPDFDKYDMRLKGKWTTDGTKNKYKYKLGVALLDIGQMKYNKLDLARTAPIDRTNIFIPPGTITGITTQDKFFIAFNSSFSVAESEYQNTFTVPLPTALSVSFDYKYSEKIYINTYLLQNLQNPSSKAMIQPSMLAVTPRIENKWWEVSMPIALQNGYKNLTVGIAGRIGGFFIGSDNLFGFFNFGSPRGVSAYTGLFIPIYKKLPKNPNECYSEFSPNLMDKFRGKRKKRK